jgi:hypothetical protein
MEFMSVSGVSLASACFHAIPSYNLFNLRLIDTVIVHADKIYTKMNIIDSVYEFNIITHIMYVGVSKCSWNSAIKPKSLKCSALSDHPQSTFLLHAHTHARACSNGFAMLGSTRGKPHLV